MSRDPRNAYFLLPLLLGSVGLGVLVVGSPQLALIFALALVIGAMAIVKPARPYVVGVLILAYMNTIPFVDLSSFRLPAGFRTDDVAMGLLVVFGLLWTWRIPRRSAIGLIRTLLLMTFAFWCFVWAKTVITGDGTIILSMFYGRDLLGMLAVLSIAAVGIEQRDMDALVGVLVLGTCIFALGHALQFVLGVDTSFLTHPYMLGETFGETRLFSKAQALVVPVLLLVMGRAVMYEGVRGRGWYWVTSLLLVFEIIIELTRANYIGLTVATLFGLVVMVRAHTRQPETRAVWLLGATGFGALAAWMATAVEGVRSWLASTTVMSRAATVSTDIAGLGGTFGYRIRLYMDMLALLGSSWPVGLGFWHPAEHYVSGFPQGSIRNNDTGLLSIMMTMGVIGTILIVAPVVIAAKWGLEALKDADASLRAVGWAAVTYAIWVATASFSLGFLSYGPGLLGSAIIVGLMAGAWQSHGKSGEVSISAS